MAENWQCAISYKDNQRETTVEENEFENKNDCMAYIFDKVVDENDFDPMLKSNINAKIYHNGSLYECQFISKKISGYDKHVTDNVINAIKNKIEFKKCSGYNTYLFWHEDTQSIAGIYGDTTIFDELIKNGWKRLYRHTPCIDSKYMHRCMNWYIAIPYQDSGYAMIKTCFNISTGVSWGYTWYNKSIQDNFRHYIIKTYDSIDNIINKINKTE